MSDQLHDDFMVAFWDSLNYAEGKGIVRIPAGRQLVFLGTCIVGNEITDEGIVTLMARRSDAPRWVLAECIFQDNTDAVRCASKLIEMANTAIDMEYSA